MKVYLGIDVGSVSTKLAVLDENGELVAHSYSPTQGNPVTAVQQGLKQIRQHLPAAAEICGVATTGSARHLAGVVVGADLVKNEITSQAVAALYFYPEVQTVIEIGGQDSKIIIIRDGLVTDFGMSDALGPRTFGHKEEMVFLGREISEQRDYSEKLAEQIDDAVYSIIRQAQGVAKKILTENKSR